MNDPAKIIERAARQVLEHNTWTDERDTLLGNGYGTIIASGPYSRMVWWHTLSDTGTVLEQGKAVLPGNSDILYQENTSYATNPPPITIGYPERSKILTVKGIANSVAGNAAQGNVSQSEQYYQVLGNPHIYSIVDWRVRPTDTPSTSVYIEAGFYELVASPGEKVYQSGTSLSLASTISAMSSGQHCLAVVYWDNNTGAAGVATTTPVAAVGALPARTELSDISSVTLSTGQDAKGTVYLYKTQTTIEQADIISRLDPRWSGSSGSLNADEIREMIWMGLA
jgi:hypothetical protein